MSLLPKSNDWCRRYSSKFNSGWDIPYRYTHLVKADIKNFYPSIYTHSIAWAIHGKNFIRKDRNRHDYRFLGNRLDRLFQYSNDQKTNGIPIGPVVSRHRSQGYRGWRG